MKNLITGGAGFIGSHLVDALIARGDEVNVIDNFSTSKREYLNPKAKLFETDIRNLESIRPAFKGVDGVFHTAALPWVQYSIQNPAETHDINVNGTFNLLIASKGAGIKKFIYSSSSSIYGNQEIMPLKEDMLPNPLSPYGLQKYIGELYCKVFNAVYGLPTVSLRYFNVYGPRLDPEGDYALVIGKFLKQRKEDKPLTIVPDGKQTRDFTHVRDVVRANILAMESDKVGRGEVINIGAGKSYSVNEIAGLIGGSTVFCEPRMEPKYTLADISKARELLGWEPKMSLEKGIQELKEIWNL